MPGPLAGIRVLELARILAGPWAGQMLADLGADVVKVERPGAGDDTRGWGPPFVEGADGKQMSAAYYHSCNRGKRSVAVDFETDEGKRIVHKLAARSDVVIENFKTGGLAKFGLDYAGLSKDNPKRHLLLDHRLRAGRPVLASRRLRPAGAGHGRHHGPDRPARTASRCAAASPSRTCSPASIRRSPCSAALNDRHATGKGSYIDMALLDTQVSVLANQASSYLVSGKAPKRMGNAHPAVVPYQVFPVADGHVIIACGNDTQFARLIALLGAPGNGAGRTLQHQCGPRGQSRHVAPADDGNDRKDFTR